MQHRGIDIRAALQLDSYLEAAGAHKIETDRVSFPIGGWHDRLGELMKINCEMQITGMKAVMTQVLQCSDEEYKLIAEASREEFTHYRTWGNVYYAFGRKPDLNAEKRIGTTSILRTSERG